MAVLREMAQFGSAPHDLVFPGARTPGQVMSDVTLGKAVGEAGGTAPRFTASARRFATGAPKRRRSRANSLRRRLGM